ncbi:Protein pygopus [Orchesella cincta]|uniref:Protein pygopus n=1 Tax=Orchesella cincta TaxID=48709 RepID=A0A1D2NE84_ORCCI|nr:Protein pygopus [Orchesella cincta]
MKSRGGNSNNDFKSPGSAGSPNSPGNPKKKRRLSTAGSGSNSSTPPAGQNSQMSELLPPQPMSGYGDTLIASNPFDDTPAPPSGNMGGPGGPPGPPPGPMMNMNRMGGPGPGMMNMGDPGGPPGPPQGPGMMNMNRMGGPPSGPNMMGGPPNMGPGSSPQGPQMMNRMGGPPPPGMSPGPMGRGMSPGPGISPGPMGPGGPMGGHGSPMGGPMGHGGPYGAWRSDGGTDGPGGPGGGGPGMNNGMNPMGMPQQQWNGPPKPMPMQSGKIYPHDQPMVFNPQNPNAPPIYPCGVCHKEVHDNDQAIPCESGCNFWFHRICTGLTEAAYHFLTQEVYAEWVCDKCLGTKNIPLVKFKP